MTIGFTAFQFFTAGGDTLGMSGARIEINGKAAPPQLLRCLDPPSNVSERDLPVKFCLPYRKRDGTRVIHCIDIDWGRTVEINQLLVWNFNGQGDLTDRGIKRLFLTVDGEALSPPQVSSSNFSCDPRLSVTRDALVQGHLVRRAPGSDHFDYRQTIRFNSFQGLERIGTPQVACNP
jgi:hypothetical protein